MLRRAATLRSRRPAAPSGGLPRHPSTVPPSFSSFHHAQAELGGAPLVTHLGTGVRGYARMVRRHPLARADGYSTSDGEEDLRAVDEEELERRAGAVGEEEEGGEDREGSEMEGIMLQYGSGSDIDDDKEEGSEERSDR